MIKLPPPYYSNEGEIIESQATVTHHITGGLRGGEGMSFGIYLTGIVIVIAGFIYGASLMHIPTHWIVVGGLVLVGIGILTGVKATRQKDSAT
jgi:predicted metalloprotease